MSTSPTKYGGGEVCCRCEKIVYYAEQVKKNYLYGNLLFGQRKGGR